MEKKQYSNAMGWYLDKMLSRLPDDPVIQTRYIYYLTGIITSTLLFFTASNFWSFFMTWTWSYLFGGLLTACFFAMSLFSFKATRNTYKSISEVKSQIMTQVNESAELEDLPSKWEEEREKKKEDDSRSYIQ